jgi:hypothetical protein
MVLDVIPRVSSRLLGLAAGTLLLWSRGAYAEEDPTALRVDVSAVFLDLQTVRIVPPGQEFDSSPIGHKGVGVGLMLEERIYNIVIGANVEASVTGLINQLECMAGGHVGGTYLRGGLEVSLLSEGGVHRFSHLAGDLFEGSDSPSIVLPYLGGRLGFAFGRSKRVSAGVWFFARADLDQRSIVVHTNGWIGPGETYALEVGGFSGGIAFHVQADLLAPHVPQGRM